jgi:outer membrane protein assembly factor BamA
MGQEMRPLSFAAILFCLLRIAPFAAAQSPPAPSSVIAEIHATGSRRYNDAQVAATAGLKPGDALTRDQLQKAADRLAQLGVFSRVNYRFTGKGDQIVLNFELEDAPVVPVLFDNFPWSTDEELSRAIRESVPLFDGTAPPGGTLLDEMTAALARTLAAHDLKGDVEHTLVAQPWADGMMIEFRQNGPNPTMGSLAFSDALAQNSEKLRDRIHDLVGKPFSRFAIEVFENEQVRPLYLSTGYLRARFGSPVIAVPKTSPPPPEVQVAVPIDPGPIFRISAFSWSGNTVLNDAALSNLPASKTGELADGMRVAADWQRVEGEYARRGYLDVKVSPQPQFDDASGKVAYRIAIIEGPQYRMGELVITGLSLDAERLVRAVWRLAPGEIFDGLYFDEMLRKLEKPIPQIFGQLPVHYAQMGHFLRTNPEKHVVDVLIDFQ